jgi:hypothetical protein
MEKVWPAPAPSAAAGRIARHAFGRLRSHARRVLAVTVLTALASCSSSSTPRTDPAAPGSGQATPSGDPATSSEPLVTKIPARWASAHVTTATMGASGLVAVGLSNGEVLIGDTVVGPAGTWSPAVRFGLGSGSAVSDLVVSADALLLAALQEDGRLSVRPPLRPERSSYWNGLDRLHAGAMALSPDKRYLVVGGLGEVVLDTVTGKTVGDSGDEVISSPSAYAFSDDSTRILESNSDYAVVHVLTHPRAQFRSGREVELTGCGDSSAVRLVADGLACGVGGRVLLYRLPAASLAHSWKISDGAEVSAVAVTADRTTIVGGTADGTVVGWHAGSDREAFRVQLGGGRVTRLDVDAQGTSVLATLSSPHADITGLRLVRL